METEKDAVQKCGKSVEIELTNMIMIEDKASGKVLVQERVKSWTGLSFPGGHVEPGESFVDSAIREVREETGLDISNLKLCGVIHWAHTETHDRYIVMLYKTSDFSGELIDKTEEGRVFWISPGELKKQKLSNNFEKYIPMFFDEDKNEAFGAWNEADPNTIIYK